LITWFLLLLATAVCLTCCGDKDVDIGPLAQALAEKIQAEDELVGVTDTVIADLYGEIGGVEAIAVYVSGSGATASELTLIKVRDASCLDDAKAAVEQRINGLRRNFENYVPSEVFRIDNALVLTRDRYLLFCISDDNADLETRFNNAF
jgi:hypothetical protein